MNDLDLSLPSRAYPSPSSSTYRRAGIFLAVHPLRNLARFIRLDLSRPCGIDSSSVARGGNTAPILPNQSSFGISPILKVARLDPSRGMVRRPNINISQLLVPVDYAQNAALRPPDLGIGPTVPAMPEIDVSHAMITTPLSLLGLNLKQGSSEQSISKIHGHGYLPFPQTLTNWAYWSAFAEVMYVPREANVGRGFVLSVLVHGVHLMIKISSQQSRHLRPRYSLLAPHPTAG
ncbi:hypothetical protein P692DRAFT_20864907 [Suillus brevipes Sb2]|nr:hypothetical protein P692DRAFT_20864907 [Suillus brevipes Sb2]